MGAESHAKAARDAQKPAREADRAEAHMVIRSYGGPAQPSATTSGCIRVRTARLKMSAQGKNFEADLYLMDRLRRL